MRQVAVAGPFDDLRSRHVRFLQEAARLGELHLLLWSDDVTESLTGLAPKFPEAERWYMLHAIRHVQDVTLATQWLDMDRLPDASGWKPGVWVVPEAKHSAAQQAFCAGAGIEYHVIAEDELVGFPVSRVRAWEEPTTRKKVIVTGCYDWLHSGHIRFFEEASAFGDLYVAVGNDASVRHLKGEGHPLQSEEERRYMVQAVRYVTQAVLTKGIGWMDAGPNIAEIQPDLYVVNEDGDKPEKGAFCAERGIEYVVLRREPREGLARRSSTELRGF